MNSYGRLDSKDDVAGVMYCTIRGMTNEDQPSPRATDSKTVQIDYASRHTHGTGPPSQQGVHVGIVVASFVAATVMIFIIARVYGSIRGGEVFILGMAPVGVCFLVALCIGLLVPVTGRRGKISLALICLVPAILLGAHCIVDDISLRINGPSDRFRDYITTQIPTTVSNLEFVPFDRIVQDMSLKLRFDITTVPSEVE